MTEDEVFEIASGGHQEIPDDWMSASQVHPFIYQDPAVIWLEFYGERNGFLPDKSQYDFMDFISNKARQFEAKYITEQVAEGIRVCGEPFDVRFAEQLRTTLRLIEKRAPVIVQPALWWAPERIYGIPDLIIHSTWLERHFPKIITNYERESIPANLVSNGSPGSYVVVDLKFTTKLTESEKKKDLQNYAAQLRVYSYILGHLQGLMPQRCFLITRDRLFDPLQIGVSSVLNTELDHDLASIRDQFLEIRRNGAQYAPWRDSIVEANLSVDDERWHTAKLTIAKREFPGGDPALVFQIGQAAKAELSKMGFVSIESLLAVEAAQISLEKCRGLGPTKSKQIRAILEANRTGHVVRPVGTRPPAKRPHEFFIDFEYFTNVNVDFERQWPRLEGCEMIFMIGVGKAIDGVWTFESFVAKAEDQAREQEMFNDLVHYLEVQTKGAFLDASQTVLFHWTSAEVWQVRRASDRHNLIPDHPLRKLPWFDLQQPFLSAPMGIPGAWKFGLKEISQALGNLDVKFSVVWPTALEAGLRAMVMGWKAYQNKEPLETPEMDLLRKYLEADCAALSKILNWMRTTSLA